MNMVMKKKNLIDDEKDIARISPKKLVTHFYNKVNIKTAALVIFIAILLETIIMGIIGVKKIVVYFLILLANSFIVWWLFIGVILFLIMYFIRGSYKVKPYDFNRVLSGLASFKIISILAMLVATIITLIFIPNLIPFIKLVFSNPALAYSATALPIIGVWGMIGVILLIILAIWVIVYYISMFYNLMGEMFETESFGFKFLMLIIFVIVAVLLQLLF
jgi:hypothetical protein